MADPNGNDAKPRVERIDGTLHEIREVRNKAGELVSRVASPLMVELKAKDVTQLIVGALVLGVPVAFTEEVWVLGEELPLARIGLVALASITILALFVKVLFYQGEVARQYHWEFVKRVFAGYTITLLVALTLLFLIGKGPAEGALLALKRAVLIALPGSLAATAVDFMK